MGDEIFNVEFSDHLGFKLNLKASGLSFFQVTKCVGGEISAVVTLIVRVETIIRC